MEIKKKLYPLLPFDRKSVWHPHSGHSLQNWCTRCSKQCPRARSAQGVFCVCSPAVSSCKPQAPNHPSSPPKHRLLELQFLTTEAAPPPRCSKPPTQAPFPHHMSSKP